MLGNIDKMRNKDQQIFIQLDTGNSSRIVNVSEMYN